MDLLLRPMNDRASGHQKLSHAHDKPNTQDIPPYENSVLYTFLKSYPKSQSIVLFKKVKCHIESTKTEDASSITQTDEEGKNRFVIHDVKVYSLKMHAEELVIKRNFGLGSSCLVALCCIYFSYYVLLHVTPYCY